MVGKCNVASQTCRLIAHFYQEDFHTYTCFYTCLCIKNWKSDENKKLVEQGMYQNTPVDIVIIRKNETMMNQVKVGEMVTKWSGGDGCIQCFGHLFCEQLGGQISESSGLFKLSED